MVPCMLFKEPTANKRVGHLIHILLFFAGPPRKGKYAHANRIASNSERAFVANQNGPPVLHMGKCFHFIFRNKSANRVAARAVGLRRAEAVPATGRKGNEEAEAAQFLWGGLSAMFSSA